MNNLDNHNYLPDLASDFKHRQSSFVELGPHVHPENNKLPKEKFSQKLKKHLQTMVKALPSGQKIVKGAVIAIALISLTSLSIEGGSLAYQNSKKEIGIRYVLSSSSSTATSLGSDEGVEELPIIVPNTHYSERQKNQTIKVTAPAYLVGDISTGEVIIDKGKTLVSPMASVSKLMTAVVTLQNIDLHHVTAVSKRSYNTFGSEGELGYGEKIETGDLMYPLLVESSNDAAEVLAEDFGHGQFMELMNTKAQALGMSDTFYDDPSGLSSKNVSTVTDLFKLTQYIYNNVPHIWDITRVKQYSTLHHSWKNQNQLLNYSEFIGGKNGYIDEARWTTASLFTLPLGPNGERHTIAILLLRSENRSGDVAALLQYIKKNVVFNANTQHDEEDIKNS